MKLILKRPLIDIFVCLLWSIIFLPIAFIELNPTLRIIIGLPLLFFIPGYMLSYVLFPLGKTKKNIENVERVAISFALSLAIVPMIGLGLNYTPEGLQLQSILIILLFFVLGFGAIALYRWHRIPPKEKVVTKLNISIPKMGINIDTLLTIVLVGTLILAPTSLIYVINIPREGIIFTEFYILNQNGTAGEYQRNLAIGENYSVILGIANHEHKIIDYTIEVWILNQTIRFNETTFKDETIYDHMWYLNKITITLDHTEANIEERWKPQWEYNYTFNITKKGKFKILFLLFNSPTGSYSNDEDYINILDQKTNSSYRMTNLWIDVTNLPKIYNVSTTPSYTLRNGFINISCSVFDADGIEDVLLIIWDPERNISFFSILENKVGFLYYYNKTYTVVGDYRYRIRVNDTTNNMSEYEDNFYIADIPQISDVWASPNITSRGNFVNISCLIYDGDGLDKVSINITKPDGSIQNYSIIKNQTGYIYFSNNRYIDIGNYNYYIWVNDSRGNTNRSKIKQFSVFI